MAQQNKISFTITSEDLELCKETIGRLCAKLLPLLKRLSPEERVELPKMGDKSLAFVKKVYEYAKENPDLVPQYMSLEELGIDIKAVEVLLELYRPLSILVEALFDTILLSGSDCYSGSLMFYNNTKYATRSNDVKAATIYNDLAARFPRGKRATDTPEAANIKPM